MEQIVDGLGKIVEGINSVDAAIDSNRVNEIIYIKINSKSSKLTSLIHKAENKNIADDYKQKFRFSQIENEGNDPMSSGESIGTPSDMATADSDQADRDTPAGSIFDDVGGAPEGGFEGAGRPKEPNKYSKDSGVRGRDPLGAHDMRKGGSASPKYGKSLALSHYDSLKKSMKFNVKNQKILTEMTEVEEDYKNEVTSLTKGISNE